MQLTDLAMFLQRVATPELYLIYQDADDLITQAGVQDYDLKIMGILSVEHTVDPITTSSNIYQYFQDTFDSVLGYYGLVLQPDTHLRFKVEILRGLRVLEDYDDPNTLEQIVETYPDTNEALAVILHEVITTPIPDLMEMLLEVNGALLDKIIETNTTDGTDITDDRLDEVTRQCILKNIRHMTALNEYLKLPTVFALTVLEQGLDIGYPLNVYADAMREVVVSIPVEEMALNLLVMAAVSVDYYQNIVPGTHAAISRLIIDVNALNLIQIKVNEYLVALAKIKNEVSNVPT